MGARDTVDAVLEDVGLPVSLADALDDPSWDAVIEAETDAALALTGKDVGTPIIAYDPPNGPAFFGPVISRVPSDDDALRLWDAVLELTNFPGFSELKRSIRELPSLRVLGLGDDDDRQVRGLAPGQPPPEEVRRSEPVRTAESERASLHRRSHG